MTALLTLLLLANPDKLAAEYFKADTARRLAIVRELDARRELTPAERFEQLERHWEIGGLPFLGAFGDTLFDWEANRLVTEYWQDLRPEEMRHTVSPTSGVGDRIPHNRAGMEATLRHLAAAVE